MNIKEITFEEILLHWKYLWPGRKSPIIPINNIDYLNSMNPIIKKTYKPIFYAIFNDNEEIIAVGAGNQTSFDLWRGRGYYVYPSYRNKGFGKLLLKETAKYGLKNNCKFVWVAAAKSAWNFYKKLGFEQSSEFISEEPFELEPHCYAIISITKLI